MPTNQRSKAGIALGQQAQHARVCDNLSSDASPKVGNIGESQPVKNRNLSRLIANLIWRNWSSECTVFIFFQLLLIYSSQKYPVLVYPIIFPV